MFNFVWLHTNKTLVEALYEYSVCLFCTCMCVFKCVCVFHPQGPATLSVCVCLCVTGLPAVRQVIH